ncbi:hypothetical protein KI387_027698, partial [Taxus chinensis]
MMTPKETYRRHVYRRQHSAERVRKAFPEAVKEVVDRELLVEEMGVAGSSSTTHETRSGEFESSEHDSCLIGLIKVGLQCTRHNPGDRPTMREVEAMIEMM